MKTIPQDSAKRRKRVRSEEEAHYYKKIKKLVKKKTKLLAKQVEEESKSNKLESPTEKKQKMNNKRVVMSNQKMEEFVANEEKKKMNSSKPIKVISNEELKEFVRNELNGKEMRLVIKKILYKSDLLGNQNRLSMPMNQLETREFLTETEKQVLEANNEFEVGLLGPRLKMHEKPMVMKMWHLKSSNSYVLRTNWNEFVEANKKDLKEKTKIQVWSFRKDEQLCFALHCV